MAKIENWNAPEVMNTITHHVSASAENFMDLIAADAWKRCPVGTVYREGKFASARIAFKPKTGKNKDKLVIFNTDKRWVGRKPGSLRHTIRKVSRQTVRGDSIRVYAGNFKIYWAFMVEFGTASTGWGNPGPAEAQPFLRPAWNAKKNAVEQDIAKGVKI